MITCYLVGDQELVDRLQTLPKTVNTGLVRSLIQLGIGVQRILRAPESHTGPSTLQTDFRIEQSGATITASIRRLSRSSAQRGGLARSTSLRASLGRRRERFARPTTANAASLRAGDGERGLADASFLRSALEEMTPTVRDTINAALAEAISL